MLQLVDAEYGWQGDVFLLVIRVDVGLAQYVAGALSAQSRIMKVIGAGRQWGVLSGSSSGASGGSEAGTRGSEGQWKLRWLREASSRPSQLRAARTKESTEHGGAAQIGRGMEEEESDDKVR